MLELGRDWRNSGSGLQGPARHRRDVEDYARTADVVARYQHERMANGDFRVAVNDLYADYHAWHMKEVSDKPLTKKSFGEKLDDLGVGKSVSSHSVRYRIGWGLIDSSEGQHGLPMGGK